MLDIQSIVFSRIKALYPAKLKTKFPNTSFTTNDRNQSQPKFPTVYVHELPALERGQTLDGLEINAVLSTFEIEVYDNVSMSNVTEVMNSVVSAMKTMRFEVVSMPEFRNQSDVYRKVARFRRIIGNGDIL